VITLARIINSFRDAEQFDFPVDARSFIWHALIIPQYALAIFSFWVYSLIGRKIYFGFHSNSRHLWKWVILAGDVLLSWMAFEVFLGYFRN